MGELEAGLVSLGPIPTFFFFFFSDPLDTFPIYLNLIGEVAMV